LRKASASTQASLQARESFLQFLTNPNVIPGLTDSQTVIPGLTGDLYNKL